MFARFVRAACYLLNFFFDGDIIIPGLLFFSSGRGAVFIFFINKIESF